MLQPISTLSLSETTISKLRENGFHYIEDIKVSELPEKCENEIKEARRAWKVPVTVSALDIWQEESQRNKVSTLCRALDDILDGGFHCDTITELCGGPGSGKTQICLQISISAQFDENSSGLNGHVIYIDTRSGLSSMRLKDMVRGSQRYCKDLHLDVRELLAGITVLSPRTADDLYTTVCSLRKRLAEDPQVRLVIVDSLSFPVQCCLEDAFQRTQFYFRILDELQGLSIIHSVAVVITNELTTEITDNRETELIGAGGQFLAHRVNGRFMLARLSDHKFAAHTLKTATIPQVSIVFEITPDGIRDAISSFK